MTVYQFFKPRLYSECVPQKAHLTPRSHSSVWISDEALTASLQFTRSLKLHSHWKYCQEKSRKPVDNGVFPCQSVSPVNCPQYVDPAIAELSCIARIFRVDVCGTGGHIARDAHRLQRANQGC